ncbi:hypothetical protein FisN_1Lh488 [Fistulifera solaris]|uniref:PH domain-containing protein n=1 Tax=Fistulifera solaris TaxID=1519565 RepID=A0A1Z5K1X4_FISSO|nr:hypothetical protein FisN_1Lh488 [Fistulifera solaris]|eukprot:GAX20031.1 hypothetical protein FisN_1Lh488 [Fistulifera solaris]
MSGATLDRTEQISFRMDEEELGRYLPVVKKGEIQREFEPEDMPRVLDFDGAVEAPIDGTLMFCVEAGQEETKFYTYHFCLRGGFLFYFDIEDVDDNAGPYVTYHGPPKGVVPLDNVEVDYPPGGRRLFREHAQSEASRGYEIVMRHEPAEEGEEFRAPSFLVADSLTRREKWADAIRSRSEMRLPTLLRAGYSSARTAATAVGASDTPAPSATQSTKASVRNEENIELNKLSSSKGAAGKVSNVHQQVLRASDDTNLAGAVIEFGTADFDETAWLNHFFQSHNDADAVAKCEAMEKWQMDMKRDLKGAVLEQYEYFVQASGEMTTMGQEVTALRDQIEKQKLILNEMKTIDFTGSANDDERDEIMGREQDDDDELPEDDLDAGRFGRKGVDEKTFFSELSSLDEGLASGQRRSRDTEEEEDVEDAPPIDVPDWLDDTVEDIESFVRECRYSDAIELYLKAKSEIADLMDKHERPTAYRLTLKQRDTLRSIKKQLEALGQKISDRLEDSLRRRNEAIRQVSKRERGDMAALLMPTISPCAINDDALYLQMLVKMGRNKEAADAFIARRSLVLLDTLNESPISGAGSVDLVIYAAQLSQSFFSSLASSVESFLDLFLSSHSNMNGEANEDLSMDASSLQSLSSKNLPAGATASVVLWCDAELTKFANAFGGARILSNLALSPPPRDEPKKPRVVGGGPAEDGMKDRKSALDVAAQCIDQAFSYAAANLDGVGLPLTPRLAECIRARLKGCEAEISLLLDDKWDHLTKTWRSGGEELNGSDHMGL